MLPLAMPRLATTPILVFVFSWNEFLYALTFASSPDRRTVPVAISLFAAEWPG
jgi:multiple sugar transport system permease protein